MSGVESIAAQEWIQATLTGNTALMALVSGVFAERIPQGGTFPAIVHQVQAPGQDVRVVGNYRVMTNPLVIVKAVGKGPSYVALVPIVARIDALLDRMSGTATDGTVLTCYREGPFQMPELSDGIEYRSLGAYWRLFVR